MLEPITKEILLENGWYPGYSYDVTQAKANLIDNGFQPHEAALEFLKKYGGLVVVVPSKATGKPREECRFDIENIANNIDIEDIIDYGAAVGRTLCPIGLAGNAHSIVTIGEDGWVFSYFSPFISLNGRSIDEAMDAMCQRKRPLKRGVYEIEGIRWEW